MLHNDQGKKDSVYERCFGVSENGMLFRSNEREREKFVVKMKLKVVMMM